jgi:DNA-directed RNA polymerase subunit RPC12/RpoP
VPAYEGFVWYESDFDLFGVCWHCVKCGKPTGVGDVFMKDAASLKCPRCSTEIAYAVLRGPLDKSEWPDGLSRTCADRVYWCRIESAIVPSRLAIILDA